MKPLDDAFANIPYIKGGDAFPSRWAAEAEAFRQSLGDRAELNCSYGSSARQVFDFFNAASEAKGTVIFVHGGYWKAFDHTFWSHLAGGALGNSWNVAMPGYDLCPDVRISDITQQIASAVTAIAERTAGPIALTGHSAGGHLVSRVTDPAVLPKAVLERVVRIAPVSPVTDLVPLLETTMNDILQLDHAEAVAESPVRMPPPPGAAVQIWVGAAERPVFVEQAGALANNWRVPCHVVPDKHHFDIIDALEHQDSDLVKFLTRQ